MRKLAVVLAVLLLVSLSSDQMVLVCTHGKDYKQEELIFMEILRRVPDATAASWKEKCPYYGLRF